ncbi:proteasome activator pa28 [Kockovaella imperatae]|uniref:Proteasome activator pa28 n=1 Tax=Kockovaella imperatae TaxID=4999 RepID=A0A1Y1UI38_9TREE|nr:proteasome activator pa28 [Kockovaella imperatae]ORX37720.1 proteasome activator pa28 [Kockovaella imperatae]
MIVQDLRVWLELEIPLIEDGNSFGADVQSHLLRELTEAYKRSNGFQNGARTHYLDRLKLTQDWVKYPNLMDFPAAIAASDRFDHVLLRSYFRSILTIYGGLLTKFERNWEKVVNPKGGSYRGGMY